MTGGQKSSIPTLPAIKGASSPPAPQRKSLPDFEGSTEAGGKMPPELQQYNFLTNGIFHKSTNNFGAFNDSRSGSNMNLDTLGTGDSSTSSSGQEDDSPPLRAHLLGRGRSMGPLSPINNKRVAQQPAALKNKSEESTNDEAVLESGPDSDSEVSSPGFTPKQRQLGGGARGLAGMRNNNHSTRSLTAIANANSFFGSGHSPFGKMVDEGSPFGTYNDSMSPLSRPKGGRKGLDETIDDSPMHINHQRRVSLLPPGGKKEIKKINQLAMEEDPEDIMAAEIERAYSNGVCDFNKLQLDVYPSTLTSDLTSKLTELVLAGNTIASIPDDAFVPMRRLVKLDLAGNKLTTVPVSLLLLPELEVLLLDHNQITELPLQRAMQIAGEQEFGSFIQPTSSGASALPPHTGILKGRSGSIGAASSSGLLATNSGMKPLLLPKIKRIGLAWNDMRAFPTELLHYGGPNLNELMLSSNPDLFTYSQPTLADFERCKRNNKDYKLTMCVDNRPRFVTVVEKEFWQTRLPWLTIEWEKIYPDKVLDFLFLGSLRTAQTPQVYEDLNIGFILTAGRDLEVHVGPGMKQLEIAVDDLPGENMIPLFEQCFEFIDEAKRARKGVLIHCFAGLSRSVTVTAAYLMKTMYPLTRDEAMVLIRQSRKAAMPNKGFMENLKTYERSLREAHGDPPLPE